MYVAIFAIQDCHYATHTRFKGTCHFFETLSVGSVPGTDYSQIYVFLKNIRFHAEKCIYIPVPA